MEKHLGAIVPVELVNRNLLPNRNNNPPSPNGNHDDSNELFTSAHYQEWVRIVRKSSRLTESIVQFIVHFFHYSFDTVCLVFTLITGVVLPGEELENASAIGLYILTCMITVAVQFTSQSSRKRNSSMLTMVTTVVMNIFMITKPLRYLNSFRVARKKMNIIDNQARNGQVITEQGLISLAKINAQEVESKKVELYEVFCQAIPMALLQTYFLFQEHQRFQLCNIKDVARLGTILIPVFHGAQACTSFESAKTDFEQSNHFIAYYRSRGNHPMPIFPTGMLSWGRGFIFFAHFATIACRFYTAIYFLPVSVWLTLLYLSAVYLVNRILFSLFPQHLLEVLENPPHGAPTYPSRIADRIINIFSNVSTRYQYFTVCAFCKVIRLPLVLIQVLHFVIPLGLVFLAQFLFTSSSAIVAGDADVLSPTVNSTTINDTLQSCKHLEGIYTFHPVFKMVGDFLFGYYKSFDDRFQSFQDMFSFIHLNWLLFYVQILATWVYAFYDLTKRKTSDNRVLFPTFPIVTGYSFYQILLTKVIESNNVHAIRKLMILHSLKEREFYRRVKLGCCSRKLPTIGKDSLKSASEGILLRLQVAPEDAEYRINNCIQSGHKFLTEFLAIRDILYQKIGSKEREDKDKLLFLAFFAYFDRKLSQMSSDRIRTMFQLICESDAERESFPWEED